jgi:hypothetical protein
MRRLDLTGKRFGMLSVVGFSEVSRNGHARFHVKCDCGVEKTILGTHLVSGKTQSCGKHRRTPRNWKGCGTVSATYFNSLKRGATGGKGRAPIDFNVSIEYLAELLDEQQMGKCALTDLPISIRDGTASVDRINSDVGYLEGNVQWLHKDVNMMKRHYSTDYFNHLCSLVAAKCSSGSCEVVDLT